MTCWWNQFTRRIRYGNKRIEELEVENQSLKAELISVKDEAVMLSAQPKGDSINLNDSKAIVDFSSMNSLEKYRYQKGL
jgi:predicted RNase H-like nuclease (RuvC/YqgF family)